MSSRPDIDWLKYRNDHPRDESYERLSSTTTGDTSNRSSTAFSDASRSQVLTQDIFLQNPDYRQSVRGHRLTEILPAQRIESPEPMEPNTVHSNRGSPKKSKSSRFVMETGKDHTSEGESRRSRRKGELNSRARSRAGKVREIGACWRCRAMKQMVHIQVH